MEILRMIIEGAGAVCLLGIGYILSSIKDDIKEIRANLFDHVAGHNHAKKEV